MYGYTLMLFSPFFQRNTTSVISCFPSPTSLNKEAILKSGLLIKERTWWERICSEKQFLLDWTLPCLTPPLTPAEKVGKNESGGVIHVILQNSQEYELANLDK